MKSPLSRDAEESALSTAFPGLPPQMNQNKRQRIVTTQMDCCRTCRLRKVKCSGNPGTGPCSNCSRLELSCNFVSSLGPVSEEGASRTIPSHSHTEAGTLRKRAQRACSQCHIHKTKCSGGLPKCKRCEAARLVCEYTPARRKFANVRSNVGSQSPKQGNTPPPLLLPAKAEEDPLSSTSSVTTASAGADDIALPALPDASTLIAEGIMIRKDVILTHFDAYMRNFYWLPCLGFMHPGYTIETIEENRFPPAQAAALCALCSYFVNPTEAGRDFGRKCSIMVESHIYQNMSKFSEDTLVLFAITIVFYLIDRSYAKVWQAFGVASRLMIGLQLNWDVLPLETNFIKQESLRRIVWHFFHIDRLLAGGFEEYICCRADNMKIRLPCNEAAFRENRPVIAERLHEKPVRISTTIGLHGIHIRQNDLRHRIQVVTKRLAAPHGGSMSTLESSKVMTDINKLQNELTDLHASVPESLKLSDQNISGHAQSPCWLGFVYFHTHMAASYMDLYAFSLPGYRDPAAIEILKKLPKEFLARSQKQAVAHAVTLARFFDAVKTETDKMPRTGKLHLAGDYTGTYMATQCIQILLIAMQYNLYHDIQDHSTAPRWRLGPLDEKQIRGYISTMLEIAEPWCKAYEANREVYESSKIAVEYFDKTRRAVDRSHPDMVPMRKIHEEPRRTERHNSGGMPSGASRPSPDEGYANRNRPGEKPVSDWWMDSSITSQQPQQQQQQHPQPQPQPLQQHQQQHQLQQQDPTPNALLSCFSVGEVDAEMDDYGPPGLPHFLAQARGTPFCIFDFAENQSLSIDTGTTLTPSDLGGIMADEFSYMQSSAAAVTASSSASVPSSATALSMMEGAEGRILYHHQHQQQPAPHHHQDNAHHHHHQQQAFVPSQQGVFGQGYGQWPAGHAESTYMSHHGFS